VDPEVKMDGEDGPDGTDGPALTEHELCALALAAEADRPPAHDAVPMGDYLAARGEDVDDPGLLPSWYMPAPMTRTRPGWLTPVVVTIVATLLLIEAAGLCSTFGQIVTG